MLRILRPKGDPSIVLDRSPSGMEEQDNLFDSTVSSPSDLNSTIKRQEHQQNMSERIFFADRAFLITFVWVMFLFFVVTFQLILAIFHNSKRVWLLGASRTIPLSIKDKR